MESPEKRCLCLASLTHLDLKMIRYDDEVVCFFEQLRTLERLKSLVLPVCHIRVLKIMFSPRIEQEAMDSFFLTP